MLPSPPHRLMSGRRVVLRSSQEGSFDFSCPPEVRPLLISGAFSDMIGTFVEQSKQYQSLSLCAQASYQEVVQATTKLPTPNALRTAVACYLLHELTDATSDASSRALFYNLKCDVFSAIYRNVDTASFMDHINGGVSSLISHSTYFDSFASLREKHTLLQHQYRGKGSFQTKQVESFEKIISRWQTMLVDRLFCAWKNYVQQKKLKLSGTEAVLARLQKRRRLCDTFYRWRKHVDNEKASKLLSELGKLKEIRETEQQRFLDEYRTIVRALDAAKADKAAQVDVISQLNQQVSDSKLEVERMQHLLEEQNVETSKWAAFARQMVTAIRPADPRMPDDAFASDPGASQRVVQWSADGIKDISAERLVLLWVNSVIRSDASCEDSILEHSMSISTKSISNYDDDFKSGNVLLHLAQRLGIVSTEEYSAVASTRIPTKKIELALRCISKALGMQLPLSALDVCAGTPSSMFCMLAALMEHNRALPLLRGVRSSCSFDASDSICGDSTTNVSLTELRDAFEGIFGYQKKWSLLFRCARERTLQIADDRFSQKSQQTVATADAFDVDLLHCALQHAGHPFDAMSSETFQQLCDALTDQAAPLRAAFSLYGSTGGALTHAKFMKFFTDTGLYSKKFQRKMGASLFDLLLARSQPDAAANSPTGAEGEASGSPSRSVSPAVACDSPICNTNRVTTIGYCGWVAAIVYAACLRDTQDVCTVFADVIQQIQRRAKSIGCGCVPRACLSKGRARRLCSIQFNVVPCVRFRGEGGCEP